MGRVRGGGASCSSWPPNTYIHVGPNEAMRFAGSIPINTLRYGILVAFIIVNCGDTHDVQNNKPIDPESLKVVRAHASTRSRCLRRCTRGSTTS